MNLAAMTLSDLEELRRKLQVIAAAARGLEVGELPVRIDLTPGQEARISFPGLFAVPEVQRAQRPSVIVLDQPAVDLPGGAPNAAGWDAPTEADLAKVGADLPESGAEKAPASAPEPAPAVKADLTEAQRAEIHRLWRGGMSPGAISLQLNLHFPQVRGICGGLAAKAARDLREMLGAPVVPIAPVEPVVQAAAPAAPAAPVAAAIAKAPTVPAPAAQVTLMPPKRSAVPDDLTGQSRTIWRHLDALGHRGFWDAATDLMICEKFAAGIKLAHLALGLDCDAQALLTRYQDLTQPIRDAKNRVTVDGQPRLLAVLRLRAKAGGVEA